MVLLRPSLIVDAVALAAASTISDPIVGDVAITPTLLVGVIVAIACLSADPHATAATGRRRVLGAHDRRARPSGHPSGPRVAAAAITVLQVVPLGRGRVVGRPAAAPAGCPSTR
jgi:hypothetical protein